MQWEIINLDNGKYKIKTRGTYVGVMPDGHLWAFLLEDMLQGAEWRINAVPQHGENAFMCVLAGPSTLCPQCVRADGAPAASSKATTCRVAGRPRRQTTSR